MIRWTRQIKVVVTNSQEGASTADESGGPLEEIAFWRSRMLDLSGITDQLSLPKVKQIVATLEAAESSYLAPYLKLADMIQNSSVQATDNLRFLTILAGPCEKLEAATPADIPALFPPILQRIRFITMNSRFYQGDQIAGLIRKVNHSIIRRCSRSINLDDVYGDNVAAAVRVLKDSIACGARWRHETLVMRAQVNSAAADSGRRWDIDETSLFAQIDAFVQRCRGLLEVCEGQGQFARRALVVGEEDEEMPSFGGASGEVIRDALLDIERQFESLVKELRMASYDVLDVNASAWHSDLQRFANGVKELEMHTTKVFDRAAEQCATVGQGVELLESFYKLAKRPAIKQCADRNAMRVYDLFRRSMERVKQEFEAGRHAPPLRGDEPQYAGAALWARGLRQRVAQDWELLEGARYMRVPAEDKEAVRSNVEQLVTELDDYIMAQYRDGWMQDMEGETHETLMARLQVPLMSRVKPEEEEGGRDVRRRGRTRVTFLAVNFDPLLLKLFSEVHYWSKLSDMDVAVKVRRAPCAWATATALTPPLLFPCPPLPPSLSTTSTKSTRTVTACACSAATCWRWCGSTTASSRRSPTRSGACSASTFAAWTSASHRASPSSPGPPSPNPWTSFCARAGKSVRRCRTRCGPSRQRMPRCSACAVRWRARCWSSWRATTSMRWTSSCRPRSATWPPCAPASTTYTPPCGARW